MPISSCPTNSAAAVCDRCLAALIFLAALLSTHAQPLPSQLEIEDNGARRTFEYASLRPLGASANEIYLYEKGARQTDSNRRRLTNRLLAQLQPGANAQTLAQQHGASAGPELAYAPGHYIFRAASPRQAWALAESLRASPGVLSAEPILARKRTRRFIPNDPLFPNQWHLLNTGQRGATPGADINVASVWNTYRGRGVVVAIVDDGIQNSHPDLSANIDRTHGIDLRDLDSDPSPNVDEDWHGTAVAGLVAARGDNGVGGIGVAFESSLIGVRMIGGDSGDDEEAEALSHLPNLVQVSNNSWGAEDDGQTLGGAGKLVRAALEHGAATGRNGLGTIYVFAAGNGGELDDSANYDTYGNSIYTIAVGAINDHGRRASYSEPGASLLICAPGGNDASRFQGITTTDLLNGDGYNFPGASSPAFPEFDDLAYTQNFSGTSAAAPIVSGVVALMLEANPGLGWRDVQEILLRTAVKTEPASANWFTNRAGFQFNPDFGAGLVNAQAAVNLAETWKNLPPQHTNAIDRPNLGLLIPYNNPAGIEVKFEAPSTTLRLEHIAVMTDILIGHRGNLAISIESPSGLVAQLAAPRSDPNPDYNKYVFSSLFNWGESPSGIWTLRISDAGIYPPRGPAANLRNARLQLYGSIPPPGPAIQNFRLQQNTFQLTVLGSVGRTYALQSTTNFTTWTESATTTPSTAEFQISDPALPEGKKFYRVLEK